MEHQLQNPAHAGMNLVGYPMVYPHTAKPRSRGDEPFFGKQTVAGADKTPLTRG